MKFSSSLSLTGLSMISNSLSAGISFSAVVSFWVSLSLVTTSSVVALFVFFWALALASFSNFFSSFVFLSGLVFWLMLSRSILPSIFKSSFLSISMESSCLVSSTSSFAWLLSSILVLISSLAFGSNSIVSSTIDSFLSAGAFFSDVKSLVSSWWADGSFLFFQLLVLRS
jgi:hypothetical protein